YGEERFAASIAKAIVARRGDGQPGRGRPLSTPAELARVVASAVTKGRKSSNDGAQHPATRTFQAIRIHINQELEELALTLEQAGAMLVTDGRLVAISFHSLEDRIVKRFIDTRHHRDRHAALDRRLPLRADQLPRATLVGLARVRPGAAEVAANPRARSAVMRVASRTAEPWTEADR
ncbi:MAG: 16S rRNA (cytosine(1402)-N(4))-methyltransferase, partial [Burkholderiaceae bacterium]